MPWPPNGSFARVSVGLKMTVPSPYSVNSGAWVSRNSIGTKPPPLSMRRTTAVGSVEWLISPAVGLGVGEGVGEGVGGVVGLGLGVCVGIAPVQATKTVKTKRPAALIRRWAAEVDVLEGGMAGQRP